jgi:8-oxo-dGTP pyrophosphatase MutT (NUDIX family)
LFNNPFLDESEINAMAVRHGMPALAHEPLEVGIEFWGPWEDKWPWRRGEVMFLLPRPGGLLLHRKGNYPDAAWRLLTGGIELTESIGEALEREPVEEVGLLLPVQRYVGIVSYDVLCRGRHFPFATHVFLMGFSDAPLRPSHDDEIAATRIVSLAELPAVAAALESLPDKRWRDWGRFRALAHRRAYQWLINSEQDQRLL